VKTSTYALTDTQSCLIELSLLNLWLPIICNNHIVLDTFDPFNY
jgi:hypothetical protein